MTIRSPAHTIAITIAGNGARPATVTVTGPTGQWSAALSTEDPENFVRSIVDVVTGELGRVLEEPDPHYWPSE